MSMVDFWMAHDGPICVGWFLVCKSHGMSCPMAMTSRRFWTPGTKLVIDSWRNDERANCFCFCLPPKKITTHIPGTVALSVFSLEGLEVFKRSYQKPYWSHPHLRSFAGFNGLKSFPGGNYIGRTQGTGIPGRYYWHQIIDNITCKIMSDI